MLPSTFASEITLTLITLVSQALAIFMQGVPRFAHTQTQDEWHTSVAMTRSPSSADINFRRGVRYSPMVPMRRLDWRSGGQEDHPTLGQVVERQHSYASSDVVTVVVYANEGAAPFDAALGQGPC